MVYRGNISERLTDSYFTVDRGFENFTMSRTASEVTHTIVQMEALSRGQSTGWETNH
jgi:hypothetical protein